MRGFIALITLLILFLISLSIGVGFALRSIGRAKTSLQINQSSQAFYLANLCAEEALMKLKENINYPGNETIQIEGGYCQILPIEGKWIIKTIGNFQNQVKKVKIIVNQVNPQTIIQSWQEVSDF
jgi:predicted chitinase